MSDCLAAGEPVSSGTMVEQADLSPRTIKIVIADDHAVVRSGLRMLLDAEDGFEVVAEAGDVPRRERLRPRAPARRARARPQHARRLEPGGDPAAARVDARRRRSSC